MTEIKLPGPDHPITFSRPGRRLRALFGGHLIADSAETVVVHEASLADVVYFPKAAVETAVLRENARTTCPYKGQAMNFTIARDGALAENAAWTYDRPNPFAAVLSDMIGFDPKVVTIQAYGEERGAIGDAEQAERMSDYIRHTDSGSGGSQADHWTPTVSDPRA